jgi:hypothetical protein
MTNRRETSDRSADVVGFGKTPAPVGNRQVFPAGTLAR